MLLVVLHEAQHRINAILLVCIYNVAGHTWSWLKLQCWQRSSKELPSQARRKKRGTILCLLHHTVLTGWFIKEWFSCICLPFSMCYTL